MSQISPKALKIQTALITFNLELKLVELPNTTRTAIDAMNAIGCQKAQIVKSLIFRHKYSGIAVFIVSSGGNRVNRNEIEKILGEPIEKADADF